MLSPVKTTTPPVIITPKLSLSPQKITKMANSSLKKNRNVIVLPKSSRREVKVPLKYREEAEEKPTVTPNKIKITPSKKVASRSPAPTVLINEKTPEKLTVSPNFQKLVHFLEGFRYERDLNNFEVKYSSEIRGLCLMK